MTLLSAAQIPTTEVPAAPTEFDRFLHLNPVEHPGTFALDLPDAWTALVGIHGGYLTSLAVRAAEIVIPERRVRTLTTSFLRSARPGPAELRLTEPRRSRSISTASVELVQDGRPVTTTRLTLVTDQDGIEWRTAEPIALPPLDDCVPIVPRIPSAHFDRAQALLDPSSLPFTDGPRAMVRGYLRPLEPRPVDAAWLAMASDWFPPPAFVRLEPPVGGISVDLTTHVHHTLPSLSDDEWLTASFEITTSAGGMATEHGRIATVDGHLLAESFQTRWMVPR
ncbi:MAG TPA: thioesterase family protein [Ilumatobacter sp.]|nr:thioesterase family protein [Ilumatobacter sp.]